MISKTLRFIVSIARSVYKFLVFPLGEITDVIQDAVYTNIEGMRLMTAWYNPKHAFSVAHPIHKI